jgi:hypothetical protein
MTSINNFDVNVYSEELHQVNEAEHDEVMMLMAEDETGWQGYGEWAADVESAAWSGAKEFNGVLVKKACEHRNCPHTRCAKAVRIGGIEI